MYRSRIFSVILVILILVAMMGCGRYYFKLFTNEIETFSKRDEHILREYNEEIIAALQKTESVDQWQKIVDSYDEIIIHIEDSDSNLVAITTDREWSLLDVKIQSPFRYGDDAYMIRSSVYFLRGYLTDSSYLFRFVIAILSIVFLVGIFLVAIIYTFMLRPIYRLYNNIERYEHGIKPKRSDSHSQIGLLQNRFVEMTETIDKQQQNQRRIIASISHDIKTPLTSIMGYAELLKKENLSPERKDRYLNTVYQKSVDIKSLIDDFDEYLSYNMESSLRKSRISVREMMEKLTDGYEEELGHIGISFIWNGTDIDEYISADIIKLRRVFGNIISNSTKHFTGDERIIKVSCLSDSKTLTITLSDNGEGVPEDKREVIFEPLYTSDEGRKVAGLGLAICREIIESHGGTISADASDMGGLSIIIKLKLDK